MQRNLIARKLRASALRYLRSGKQTRHYGLSSSNHNLLRLASSRTLRNTTPSSQQSRATCLSQISDLILDPPATNMYEALKKRLGDQYADSEEKRMKKLLTEIDLGDKRPSQLLREMRELASHNVSEELLKSLWLQRLPQQTQAILAISNEDCSKLASMADKILEIADVPVVHALASSSLGSDSTSSTISTLEAKILELSMKVDELTHATDNNRRRSRYPNRSRSRSKSKQLDEKKGSSVAVPNLEFKFLSSGQTNFVYQVKNKTTAEQISYL